MKAGRVDETKSFLAFVGREIIFQLTGFIPLLYVLLTH